MSHIILRRPDGGRVAVRKSDVAVVQRSPWGSIVILASNSSSVEVEYTVEELTALLPDLRFHANDTILNPDHIISVSETPKGLDYIVAGGVTLTQSDADIDQYIAAMQKIGAVV